MRGRTSTLSRLPRELGGLYLRGVVVQIALGCAEVASWVRGVERAGTRAVRISGEDPLAMFRSFVALTYITRVSQGR